MRMWYVFITTQEWYVLWLVIWAWCTLFFPPYPWFSRELDMFSLLSVWGSFLEFDSCHSSYAYYVWTHDESQHSISLQDPSTLNKPNTSNSHGDSPGISNDHPLIEVPIHWLFIIYKAVHHVMVPSNHHL